MTIAVTEEHQQLGESVRRWAQRHCPAEVARKAIEAEDELSVTPWRALAEQGLLGLHVPEDLGGAGYGDVELAVVAEELGRALVPGPVLPTLHASRLLAEAEGDPTWLTSLAEGRAVGAVALEPTLHARVDGDGLTLSGTCGPVLGGDAADVLVLGGTADDGAEHWALLDAGMLETEALDALDATRGLARVRVDGVTVPEARRLVGLDGHGVHEVALLLYGAEAAGLASWACDEAASYARLREQFGRPIGQFQAVKHLCAQLLVRVEQARATVWDLAMAGEADRRERGLSAAAVGAVAVDAGVTCSLDAIQILGGIGFTWEHDAHLYLRRASSLRALLGGPDRHRHHAAARALDGSRRTLHLHLDDPEARRARDEVRGLIADLPEDADERQRALADAGLVAPHWPRPWGRDAGPVEQLVIAEELDRAEVTPAPLVIGGWILPTIIAYGSPEQQERFVRPTLHGEITWCQMFSEPGAGSDLAALSTRATRVEGGWTLRGQKVWTSLAHEADWGLALARTDPDAPKHEGITAFLIDMESEGLDIRPLREITGNDMFNEVFLNDVFVPDELVCGPVNGGWKAARNTLANERVAMSSGSSTGSGVEAVLQGVSAHPRRQDPLLLDRVGDLVCEAHALGVIGYRTTLRQLSGLEPGAGSSVRKLVGGHHARRCAELGLELLGPEGATTQGAAGKATFSFLQTQCLTIAGGTTAVQLNVIAERLLGLPRDDAPTGGAA
jgi:3-oxochol-4-en-24-oyl-CoA dehydrogenase